MPVNAKKESYQRWMGWATTLALIGFAVVGWHFGWWIGVAVISLELLVLAYGWLQCYNDTSKHE